MADEKIKLESAGDVVERVTEWARFKSEREQLILRPNCYRVIALAEVNNQSARGNISKVYVVVGSSGETIMEFSRSVDGVGCEPVFLEMMEVIFNCKIKVDEKPRFIGGNDAIDLKYRFLFVPVKEFFPDKMIWPFGVDKDLKQQLFYCAFDEEDVNSYVDLNHSQPYLQSEVERAQITETTTGTLRGGFCRGNSRTPQ